MQIQNKKAFTPHHVHSTMQPPSKITVCTMYCTRVLAYATKYLFNHSTQLTICSMLKLNTTHLNWTQLYFLCCLHWCYSVPLWSDVYKTFHAASITAIQSLSEEMSTPPSTLPTLPLFCPSLKQCQCHLLCCQHRHYSVPLLSKSMPASTLPTLPLFSFSLKKCLHHLLCCQHCHYSVQLWSNVYTTSTLPTLPLLSSSLKKFYATFYTADIPTIQSRSEAMSTPPATLPTSPLFCPSLKQCLCHLLLYAYNIPTIQSLSEAMSTPPAMLPTLPLFCLSLKQCLCHLLHCQHPHYSVPLWSNVYATCYAANIATIMNFNVNATFYADNIPTIQSLSEAMSTPPAMLPTLPIFCPSLKQCLCHLLRCQHRHYSVPLLSKSMPASTLPTLPLFSLSLKQMSMPPSMHCQYRHYSSLSEPMSIPPSTLPTLPLFSPSLKQFLHYLLCRQHPYYSVLLWSDIYSPVYASFCVTPWMICSPLTKPCPQVPLLSTYCQAMSRLQHGWSSHSYLLCQHLLLLWLHL